MQSIGQQINDRLYSYRKRDLNSIAIDSREVDSILDSYPQLIEEKYRGWFVLRLKKIGKQTFIEKAERSLKYGKNPQKMFVYLLSQI